MPFTPSQIAAALRARITLDGVPVFAGQLCIPTGPSGPRPDAAVPPGLSVYLGQLLAQEAPTLAAVPPDVWAGSAPGLSRMATAYLAACAAAGQTPYPRFYWATAWAAADAGVLTAEPLPQALATVAATSYRGLADPIPPPGAAWPPAAILRDATPDELSARGLSPADLDAYVQAAAQVVPGGPFSDAYFAVRALGTEAQTAGLGAPASAVTREWLREQGFTPDRIAAVAARARATTADVLARFGFVTPAHGWHVASALRDDTQGDLTAAMTAFVLAGYEDGGDELAAVLPPPPPPSPPGGPPTGSGDTPTKPDTGSTKPDTGSTGTPDTGGADSSATSPVVLVALGLGAAFALSRLTR